MSRSALLPVMPRFPVVGLWMKFYERWQDEVDKLEINFNQTSHGDGIRKLVENTKADYIMLIEYDGIIFGKGFVDENFKLLESGEYDVIGSPRMSCGTDIAKLAADKWGLNYEGEGDNGPNFWPNFLFTKTKHLLATDRNFGSHHWKPGEHMIPFDILNPYDYDIGGDTFVNTSLQLRAMGLKIKEIPQYHAHPDDLENYKKNTGIFDGKCRYFHIGSLSGDVFRPQTEMEQRELERRLVWHGLAGGAIEHFIRNYDLDTARMSEMKRIYKELVRW